MREFPRRRIDGFAVIDKLYRQINRYRGKRRNRRRAGVSQEALVEGEALPLADAFEDEEMPPIVRRKRFELMPMMPDEAIDQMELLGHDFFVFYNTEEAAINVVYKRRDGNYGLLLPEMD